MFGVNAQLPNFYRLPLIPLLFFFMAGSAAGRFLAFYPFLHIGAWITVSAAVWQIIRLLIRKKSACFSPLLLFAALGLLAIAPWKPPFFPPADTEALLDLGYHEISGTVTGQPRIESFRTRCVLDQLKIRDRNGTLHLPAGRIQAAVYGTAPELSPGDRLEFKARLRPFKNFNNPKGFDYRQFMTDRKIWASAYANSKSVKIYHLASVEKNLEGRVHGLRTGIDNAIAARARDNKDASAVLSALVVGKRDRITKKVQNSFNRAGVSHLLAISGLHVGIVATFSFLVIKLVISRFKILLYTGWSQGISAILTFIPVMTYGLLSGMSPSTQRAVIMVAVFLGALARCKPYHNFNTLAVAALVICVIHPPSLFSVSFQLSFAAVAAIFFGLYIFPDPGREIKKPVARIPVRIGRFMQISAFAILGTIPLVMHHFHQASVLGVFANIVMVPWIGFAVVPMGLLSAMVFPFSQTISGLGLTAAHEILAPAISVIRIIAKSPVGSFNTFSPTIPEIICIYGFIITGGLLLTRQEKNIRKPAAIGLIFVLLASAADAGFWIKKRFLHKDLLITVLDVGQGHASLLRFPGGQTMLIDGGGFSDNSLFDVGERIVAPYLRQRKIGTIDTVVLSHPDADHLNGLLYILKHFRIGEVISTHKAAGTDSYKDFIKILNERQIRHPAIAEIKRQQRINGIDAEIIYPWPDPEISCAACPGANNCSLVIRISYGGKAVLFPGDIEACAEKLVVDQGHEIKADVLIAPHHGSRNSSSAEFLDAVNPGTVVIPVRHGRYDLPSEYVLDQYRDRGYKILRTDGNGAVHIRIHEKGLQVRPEIKSPDPAG